MPRIARNSTVIYLVAAVMTMTAHCGWAQQIEVVNGDTLTPGYRDGGDMLAALGGLPTDPARMDINALDSGNFPLIFGTAAVDTFGVGHGGLMQADFEVYENSVLQTDLFQLTPPDSSGGGIRVADIVFVVDNSGSMGGEQAAIDQNLTAFVDSLQQGLSDVSLGLVRFGQSANGGSPIFVDGGALTLDLEYYKTSVWPQNDISGSIEPGWEALHTASIAAGWRPGSQRIIIWLGDEDPSQGATTVSTATSSLLANNVTLFAFANSSYFERFRPATGPSIVDTTNGELYNITDGFDGILNSIATTINSTYTFRYQSSDVLIDGSQREVVLRADVGGTVVYDTTHYTPDKVTIQRTQSTLDLHLQGQVQNNSLVIEADISDYASPFIQSATLFYKATGSASFSSVAMSVVSGTIYSATIPAAAVLDPSVKYYITATDGQKTASDPSTNASVAPYQIAVLPNELPVITHTPPGPTTPGSAVTLVARVTDSTANVDSVFFAYRPVGTLSYSAQAMTDIGGGDYEGTISGGSVIVPGVQYYIGAFDNYGVSALYGTPDQPIVVSVNTPPVLAAIGAMTITTDDTLSISLSATDADGDPLTFSVSGDTAGSLLSGSIFSWAPGAKPAGSYTITFVVADGRGGTDSETVIITVDRAGGTFVLELTPGFNLVSLGVTVDNDSIAAIVRPIIGDLIRVVGFETPAYNPNPPFTGGKIYDPALPAFVSSLKRTDVHLGYWFKMSGSATLVVGVPQPKVVSVAGGPDPRGLYPVYDFMGIHGRLRIDGAPAPVGTVVEVTDDRGTLAGRYDVDRTGYYGFLPIYRDDPDSQIDEGAETGEWLTLWIDGQQVPERVQWTAFGDVVQLDVEAVSSPGPSLPAAFALLQNYPNPFNPTTTLSYQLPQASHVVLTIWSLAGQRVRQVVDEHRRAGSHSVVWDARDETGSLVANGVYLYEIRAGDLRSVRKMVLVK